MSNDPVRDAVRRISNYQGGDPIFIFVDNWHPAFIGVIRGFCKAQGLTVTKGMARGKKTLRISK